MNLFIFRSVFLHSFFIEDWFKILLQLRIFNFLLIICFTYYFLYNGFYKFEIRKIRGVRELFKIRIRENLGFLPTLLKISRDISMGGSPGDVSEEPVT